MSTLPDCAKSALLLIVITIPCLGITIQRVEETIPTKTKIELSPISIQTNLNHMIQIAVPIINEHSVYRLHKPNGDTIKLNITPNIQSKGYNNKPINIKYNKNTKPIIQQINKYKSLSMVMMIGGIDSEERNMVDNEVMIGPLQEEDGGNWVLSVYTKDLDDNWIELFQVISILMTETIPLNHKRNTKFYIGDTINVSFAYPIKNIESCDLIAPRTTFDRFYTRNHSINYNNCGFTIPKLTEKDKGAWAVIGVTKNNVSYLGELVLKVKKRFGKKRTESLKLFYFTIH